MMGQLRTSSRYRTAPIGVLDSGVGGLSILRELHRLLPGEDFVFFADQGHVPYGEKTLDQVRGYVEQITHFLLGDGHPFAAIKLMVVACNTASAAALYHLRERFPQLKFVGMEPAIKPASRQTKSGHIGVIATAATFQGELYASLIDRFAQNIDVHARACPQFVTLVERGGPYDAADRALVRDALASLVAAGIDQLVLGCTHFPFLTPLIQQSLVDLGAAVDIVDPSAAVARQVRRVLNAAQALHPRSQGGQTVYLTSGDLTHFRHQVLTLLALEEIKSYPVQWRDGKLSLVESAL